MAILLILAILAFVALPFAILGYRQSLRLGLAILACLILVAVFSLLQPTSPDLNESDQIGNGAARLLVAAYALIALFEFAAGFLTAKFKQRRTSNESQIGFE